MKTPTDKWDRLESDYKEMASLMIYSVRNVREQRIIFPSLAYMYYAQWVTIRIFEAVWWLEGKFFALTMRLIVWRKEDREFFEEEYGDR